MIQKPMTIGELIGMLPKEMGLLKAAEVEVRINGLHVYTAILGSDESRGKPFINLQTLPAITKPDKCEDCGFKDCCCSYY